MRKTDMILQIYATYARQKALFAALIAGEVSGGEGKAASAYARELGEEFNELRARYWAAVDGARAAGLPWTRVIRLDDSVMMTALDS